MNYTKVIRIPPNELKQMQDFLDSKGEDKVDTIKTYTANFGDNGEGVIEVDVKVCQGDPPFVDTVLFQDGHEVGCLEADDTLVGEYPFIHFLKDSYTVLVQEAEKVWCTVSERTNEFEVFVFTDPEDAKDFVARGVKEETGQEGIWEEDPDDGSLVLVNAETEIACIVQTYMR